MPRRILVRAGTERSVRFARHKVVPVVIICRFGFARASLFPLIYRKIGPGQAGPAASVSIGPSTCVGGAARRT